MGGGFFSMRSPLDVKKEGPNVSLSTVLHETSLKCVLLKYISIIFLMRIFFFLLGNTEEGIWGYTLSLELCIKLYLSPVPFYYVIKNLFGLKPDQ